MRIEHSEIRMETMALHGKYGQQFGSDGDGGDGNGIAFPIDNKSKNRLMRKVNYPTCCCWEGLCGIRIWSLPDCNRCVVTQMLNIEHSMHKFN